MPATLPQSQALAKNPLVAAKTWLNAPETQASLKEALRKSIDPLQMARLVLTACQENSRLLECFQTPDGRRSVGIAMMKSGGLGLELNGRDGHIVPFRDRNKGMLAQFIPGYQGLIGLSFNHPRVKGIWAEVVYEKDEFREEKGSAHTLVHVPYDGDDDPGPLKAAYAMADLDGGGRQWVVLRRRDIARIRASSRGADDPFSPWQKHPGEMWKKSAVRQLCKFIPRSSELQTALSVEDEYERGNAIDVEATVTTDADAPKPQIGRRQTQALPLAEAPASDAPPVVESPAQPNTDDEDAAAAGLAPVPPSQPQPPPASEPAAKAEPEPQPEPPREPKSAAAPPAPAAESAPAAPAPSDPLPGNENTLSDACQMLRNYIVTDCKTDFAGMMKTINRFNFTRGIQGADKATDWNTLPERAVTKIWTARHGLKAEIIKDNPATTP